MPRHFTLIELLVVIAIIAILAGMLLPAFLEYARLEHPTVKGTIKAEVRRIKGEVAEMELEVPEGTTAFVTFGKTQREAKSGRHLIKGELPLE